MSLSREFAAFVAGLKYEDLPAAVVDRAKGVTLQALASALVAHDMPASQQALALMQEEEAGGGGAATVLCNGAQTDQGRRRLCQYRDDLCRRQMGHLPHADPSRHRDPAGGIGRGGNRRRLGRGFPRRGRRRLRGHGADGRRVHPDRHVARLSRRAGVRHLRRGDRRRQARRARRRADPRRDRAMRQPRLGQSRRRAQRRPLVARRRRGAQRAARGRVGAARHAGRRDDAGGRGRLLPCLCRQQPRRAALQLHRRQPRRPGEDHRKASGATGSFSKRCTGSIRPPATTSRMST